MLSQRVSFGKRSGKSVGHSTTTASHYKRSLTDIKDRLINGTAQQWAYINLSIPSLSNAESAKQQVHY